ncbi:MAG: DUF3482 domain-containing protein [Verrucomicrobiae bacterium]|nr:DUF3482 domain-containing protein [Verrucomicrobiae bacterium]
MPDTVVLSLISHTNAGKTTLLRTLLRQDVGEIADRAHVTVESKVYPLIQTDDESATLELWDTPGFGANLAKLSERLRQQKNPIGWMMHQIWDRHQDASLFHSQEALRNVQNHADIVLYVVDMSQKPEQVGYVDAEMEVLSLMGKPVIVVLNQTGSPEPAAAREREESIRKLLDRYPVARHVLTLDAFTRCWVQEHHLLDLVCELIEDSKKKKTAKRLTEAWTRGQLEVFGQSVDLFAKLFAESVTDNEAFLHANFLGRVKQMLDKEARHGEFDRLQQAMYERLRERTENTVNQLITLHGIDGTTARKFSEAAREQFSATGGKVDEMLASIGGGALTGLVGGVVLDLASHGISFGSGAAIGAILGGATSYALAKGYNLTQGDSQTVRWTEAHFRDQVRFSLLLYLAVAHFGRGRGRWQDAPQDPEHWAELVTRLTEKHRDAINDFWKRGKSDDPTKLAKKRRDWVATLLQELLTDLYPEAGRVFS